MWCARFRQGHWVCTVLSGCNPSFFPEIHYLTYCGVVQACSVACSTGGRDLVACIASLTSTTPLVS